MNGQPCALVVVSHWRNQHLSSLRRKRIELGAQQQAGPGRSPRERPRLGLRTVLVFAYVIGYGIANLRNAAAI